MKDCSKELYSYAVAFGALVVAGACLPTFLKVIGIPPSSWAGFGVRIAFGIFCVIVLLYPLLFVVINWRKARKRNGEKTPKEICGKAPTGICYCMLQIMRCPAASVLLVFFIVTFLGFWYHAFAGSPEEMNSGKRKLCARIESVEDSLLEAAEAFNPKQPDDNTFWDDTEKAFMALDSILAPKRKSKRKDRPSKREKASFLSKENVDHLVSAKERLNNTVNLTKAVNQTKAVDLTKDPKSSVPGYPMLVSVLSDVRLTLHQIRQKIE